MLKFKCRLCRRAEKKLYLKGNKCSTTKCPIVARNTPPGGVTAKKGNKSDFALQLKEKQIASRSYLMREKQFKLLYQEFAKRKRKNPNYSLVTSLELRLSNVLYKGGLALSKENAKQLITHKFVSLNDKLITIPSIELKVGDKITFDKKKLETLSGLIQQLDSLKRPASSWIEKKGNEIYIKELPNQENNIQFFDEQKIVQHYSR